MRRLQLTVVLLPVFQLALDPVRVPPDPGLYYLSPQGITRIEGRAATISESHSHVPLKGSIPTQGPKAKAQILGERADTKMMSTPVFYYRVARGGEATGSADLVLVKLKAKHGYREFEISSEGEFKSGSGIPLKSQLEVIRKQAESGVYKLVPAHDLPVGQYGFYLFRGHEMPGLIFDFEVTE